MQLPEPQPEHHWLQQMVGEWTCEMECVMGPDQPPQTHRGTDSVRSLGGLWVVCEGRAEMSPGCTGTTIMTLGYDPAKGRYIGSFIGSMMTFMWLYEGGRESGGAVLTLDTEGPSFTDPKVMAKYQDIIEIVSDDHRTLSSQYRGDDGQWQKFMTAHYRRVK